MSGVWEPKVQTDGHVKKQDLSLAAVAVPPLLPALEQCEAALSGGRKGTVSPVSLHLQGPQGSLRILCFNNIFTKFFMYVF